MMKCLTVKKFMLLSMGVLLLLSSCGCFYGDLELGGGYILWKDGGYQDISYYDGEDYDCSGSHLVLDENVVKYSNSPNHLLLECQNSQRRPEYSLHYWIIDKSVKIDMDYCKDQTTCDSVLHAGLTGPFDSISFHGTLSRMGISLHWEEED